LDQQAENAKQIYFEEKENAGQIYFAKVKMQIK